MILKTDSEDTRRQLSLLDSVSIIVGIIVGVGIFETTPLIASNTNGQMVLICLWILGGVLALAGALCFAELAAAYPKDGGDYAFLTRAFGKRLGFLFAWAQFWIIRPGNIGAMAFVFARYADQIAPLGLKHGFLVYACSSVILLTAINAIGIHSGKWTQNLLSGVKVAGLLAIFAAAFFSIAPVPQPPPAYKVPELDFRFAMIMVLFTYGGWNDVSFVAAEVRRPERNLFRALLIGTLTVTLIYVLVNLAFLRGLGFHGVAQSEAVAADVLNSRFGDLGSRAISLLICCSCLGAINGMTFTGARIFYALGREQRAFAWLGTRGYRTDVPTRAIVGQSIITLGLVIAFGLYEDGFERMVLFSVPVFWFFLLCVGIALFVLRITDADTPRPYRVLFFPFTPIVFCLTCAFMIYSSGTYAFEKRSPEGLWACAVMAIGIVFCFGLSTSRREKDAT